MPLDWVSPDGTSYTYPSADAIEVVSVATGAAVHEFGKGNAWQVLDLENGGVYAYIVKGGASDWPPAAASGGLWVFPYTSAGHEIENTQTLVPVAVKGTIAYFVNTYIPAQPTSSIVQWLNLGGNGRGVSFSLSSSLPSDLYTWVGAAANGFVFAWLQNGELWYAKDSSDEHKLDLAGDSLRLGVNSYSVLSDANGTWITGAKHLYLLKADGRLARAGEHTGSIAGTCV